MPRATWAQHSFTGGEWSPLAYGRSDADAYKAGLETCLNYIPTMQGGLTRRPGTRYAAKVKTAANAARLVPFEFSTTQAYILEFGDYYVRFYTNDGQLLVSPGGAPYEVATPYPLADVWGLSFAQSADVLYLAHKNWTPRKLMRYGPTNWLIAKVSYTDGPYLPTNTSATVLNYSTVTGATTVKSTQVTGSISGTTLTVTAVTRGALDVGMLVVWSSTVTGVTILSQISGVTGGAGTYTVDQSTTLTSRELYNFANINGGAGFTQSDRGRWVRAKAASGSWGYGFVSGLLAVDVVAIVWTTPPGTGDTTLWRLGVWYGYELYAKRNFPSIVTFHQDRLVFANTPDNPARIDASNTSDYENFAPTLIGGSTDGTVVDSNALAFTLNSAKVNAIQWLLSDEWGLLAGTTGGEWVVAASSQLNAMTPTNVTAREVSSYGSTGVRPVKIGRTTMFVQRTLRKIREFVGDYSLGLPAFKAVDVSAIAEHLTIGGIKQMALQQAPQPIVWMITNGGRLIGLSYDKELSLIAWHQHQIGGWADDAKTIPAQVESIAVIPSPDGTRDELWLEVYRRVNGADVRTVEYLTKFWESGDAVEDAYFVDCGNSYSGAPTQWVVGAAPWLPSTEVTVLVDGATHPACTLDASGNLTLLYSASKIQFGFGYTSTGKTLRIEAGGADGTAQGKYKRIHRAIFRFFETVGMTVQATNGNAYPEPWRSSADRMDNPVALYTGDKRWAWEGSYELEGQITWSQTDPLPSNVLMVVAQLETQDGG